MAQKQLFRVAGAEQDNRRLGSLRLDGLRNCPEETRRYRRWPFLSTRDPWCKFLWDGEPRNFGG